MSSFVCETSRLRLRRLDADDSDFILRLLNEPSFLANIGDRGVRSADDALRYLCNGPMASYARFGFGLFHVSLREGGDAIGMCGLLKRDWLEDVDVGFAFFPAYWGKGYAYESSVGVIDWGKRTLGIAHVCGITKPDNVGSIAGAREAGVALRGRRDFA